MRYTETDQHDSRIEAADAAAEELRKENEELKRQIEELRSPPHSFAHPPEGTVPAKLWRPSRITLWSIALAAVIVAVIAFAAGYMPLHDRSAIVLREAHRQEQALPRFEVIKVGSSSSQNSIELPGNIQALTEAPILARADGYVLHRRADIGDRVRAGQILAEIVAPELDHQVRQANSQLGQAQAALDEAIANLAQGKAELELARVTAKRWGSLVNDGSVSQQENDQYQAQYQAKIASIQALDKAVNVQRSSVSAAEANLARLTEMGSYRTVVAPFDGVVTLRNVDEGALVNAGSTLLFRIAQIATLRLYVTVPQSYANSVRTGQAATLIVSNMPGQRFTGTVARTANSLDPASRTLLVEVRVPNPTGTLFPGMYAEVELTSARVNPPLSVPSDALILRGEGAEVAVVQSGNRVHLQKVQVGRDYGNRLELINGLQKGDTIIAHPGDVLREGAEIDPVPIEKEPERTEHTGAGN